MCPGINPGFVKVSLYSLSQGTHGVPKTRYKCPFYTDLKTNHATELASEASHEGRGDFLLPTDRKSVV